MPSRSRSSHLAHSKLRVGLILKVALLVFVLGLAKQFASNVVSLHEIVSDDPPPSAFSKPASSEEEYQGVPLLADPEPSTKTAAIEEAEAEAGKEGDDDDDGGLELPSQDASPPPSPSQAPKRAWKLSELFSVIEDQSRFSRSEFGYAADLIVVTQENAERLRAKVTRPERFLPPTSPFAESIEGSASRARYRTCALVGNAGIARAAPFGESIDKHEAVLRINQGPSKGYEKIVGSKTTFRLLNKKWVSMYTSATEGRKVFLPSEAPNATILASRISGRSFEHLASVVRHARRDIDLLYVAQGLESRARNLLKGEPNSRDFFSQSSEK